MNLIKRAAKINHGNINKRLSRDMLAVNPLDGSPWRNLTDDLVWSDNFISVSEPHRFFRLDNNFHLEGSNDQTNWTSLH